MCKERKRVKRWLRERWVRSRVQEVIIRHIKEKDPELFREAVHQPEAQKLLREMGIGGEET